MTIKLAIGIPAYGGMIASQHAAMWLSIGRAIEADWEGACRFERGASLISVDIAGVERARNRLLAEAMIAEADWLLMIDADTWIADDGDRVLEMIYFANHATFSIVAAPVRIRAENCFDVAAWRSGKRMHAAMVEPELQPVDAVGAACMAVKLHDVAAAQAKFALTDQLGEDLEFCRQMREAGYRIALDGRVSTGHLARSAPLFYPR